MTVAIYVRVSTDEQAEQGFSLDSQKERLIAYCISQGWDDFKLFIDDGYTGTKLERPAMKRMIRNIEEEKIQAVVVYKLDRLSRKQKDVLYLLEDVFEKNKVIFKSATEPFDTSTPFGKAMIGVLAVFAQLERDMIVERTTTGRRQKISQGLWHGGPIPFGYHWNKEGKQLEVKPEEAHLIKEIYKRYLQGQSRLSIADWIVSRSKARVFDHNVVRDILSRPLYNGKLINAGVIVQGNHEAIIDEDTWYAVQKETVRRSGGQTPLGEYLLTGLLRCGVCSRGVAHVKRTTYKREKKYSYDLYGCVNQHVRRKDRNNNCSMGYLQRKEVEQFVISEIKAFSLKPKMVIEIQKQKTEQTADDSVIQALKEKYQKVINGMDNLYEAIQTGGIKASFVSDRIKKLEEEREAIEIQLEDIEDDKPKHLTPENVYRLIREIGETWDLLTYEEQKIMLRKAISSIALKKGEDPVIQWNIWA